MKKDIATKADIELLVNSFYDKVKIDPVIGYIFTDIVKVNWQKHLPVMYTFWENALFYTGSYTGNPMELHKHLNKVIPLKAELFRQWNKLFIATVDSLFSGEKALLAKQRAISISNVMQIKILEEDAKLKNEPPV
jgi:hemoglobin